MDETTRRARELNALENIAADLERLRVLKEHGLGVRPEYDPDGGSYVPETFATPSSSVGCLYLNRWGNLAGVRGARVACSPRRIITARKGIRAPLSVVEARG